MKDKHSTDTHTAQGFLKAKFITEEQAEQIFVLIASGEREGTACRTQGTSYTQLLRRVRNDPPLKARLREAEVLQHQARKLQSEHAERTREHTNKDAAGVHESTVPD